MLQWLHDLGNQVGYVPGKAVAGIIGAALILLAICVAGPLTAVIGNPPWKR